MEAMLSRALMHNTVHVNGIKMHYVESGEGWPVLLLHGFPETWYTWRNQIPELAKQYRVIAPDLRGYGATEKAATGYDKATMARDILELMHALGVERAAVIGHDRGARVGLRFAKNYPEAVSHFAALDNIPTRTIFERMNATVARSHWFFLFNAVHDLPEALVTGKEEMWLRFIFSSWCHNPDLLSDEDIAVYVKAYSSPGALRGAFSDYRAANVDVEQDKADEDRRIEMPTLILWGEEFAAGGKLWDFREVWADYATRPQFVSVPSCGHLPQEEKPQIVTDALLAFLAQDNEARL
jgi:haloacetate dehalogenase